MVGLRADRQLAGRPVCGGAVPAGGTRATNGPVKPDADDRIARDLVSRPPVDAGMSLGTVRLLGLPLEDNGLQVIALPFPPLPTLGPKRRTHHLDLMRRPGGDQ
jgi:hypothetical protein